MPLGCRVKIGAFSFILGCASPADPIHHVSARALLHDHPLGRMAASQAAQFQGAQCLQRHVRNVDIEQPRRLGHQVLRHHLRNDFAGFVRRSLDFAPAFVHLGYRHGRNAKKKPLHGSAHGARIDGVVAHVGAVVDAGYHQIGSVSKQSREGDMNAIGRRAIHIAKAVGCLVHIQR